MMPQEKEKALNSLSNYLDEGIIDPATLVKGDLSILHAETALIFAQKASPDLSGAYAENLLGLFHLVAASVGMFQTKEQAREAPHITEKNNGSFVDRTLTEAGNMACTRMNIALTAYNNAAAQKITKPVIELSNNNTSLETRKAYQDYLSLRKAADEVLNGPIVKKALLVAYTAVVREQALLQLNS